MDFEQQYFDGIYGGDYDRRNPRWKARSILASILRFRTGGRLLDIGCAYGAFLAEASRTGRFELSGTDVSEHAIQVARERLEGKGVELRVGGLFDTGHEPGSVDIACLFDVIEHIPDLQAAFAEIQGLLAPDGLLVLSVPVYDGLVGRLVERLDKDPTHVHKLGRSDWVDACTEHGFEVLHWMGLFRYFLAGRVYLHRQSLLFREMAPAILVFARPLRPVPAG